ncbi:nucleoside-diphosphate sugar epimerase/dehydratase [Cryobacterium sp. CG_9.6]|uniref:polysaccharide biosynthesis protein n=1 Tax=Cryobacterium sp. CG_9.6 TaxID=2760710 RepID=UPI00247714B9|nr:nucleoside-diphosphate sugar epimerase/dehydratase [Cryobacterium sp. CG_9.6]MDH6235801.1 dTDP-glucose 4,6-dehydratase [Cryobacterium sp. CG_9.6]
MRFSSQFLLDALCWLLALSAAQALRYEFDLSAIVWIPLLLLWSVACVLQLLVGLLFYLYQGRHQYGSFAEVRALLGVVLSVAVLIGLPVAAFGAALQIPRSTVLIALPIAFVFMGGVRYVRRLVLERSLGPGEGAVPVLIYGAGYLGAEIIRHMKTDRRSSFRPIGLIDDDPLKRNVWFDGVRVLGTRSSLPAIVDATGAVTLVVAIAKADAALLRAIADVARVADLRVLVLPPWEELLTGRSRLNDLRDISIEDLIGRPLLDTDVESVAGYLTGKRVLVTGAGGSIGAELCRQIHRYAPRELIMLDRDETGLQTAQISIRGHGLLDTRDVVLADIRDVDALNAVFEDRQPEVVFHAAALKHLPILEQYPDEAWKTNVLGTRNVLEAARAVNVSVFVNISTDKAARPTSVLGHSKRLAERLTASMAEQTGCRYLSVRFGNVIGSRGSMLPTFTALIEAGGPLTITDPEATRFFMTIPEACQLVVQAGGIGRPAEVLILDMGEQVKILDVARRMIDMSGQHVEIVFTGLRRGEKLHEDLRGEGESDERPLHPKISHATITPLSPARLDKAEWDTRWLGYQHIGRSATGEGESEINT